MTITKTVTMIAIMLMAISSYADETVDGLSMLKNDHIAAAAGMGMAVVSQQSDPNFLPYNPAVAAGIDKFTASFGHTEHWENIRFESGHFGTRLFDKWYLHGGIRYAADDEMEMRGLVPTEEPISTFDAHDISLKTGVACQVNERWAAGIALGFWIEEIGGWRGTAFNVDLGVTMKYSEKLNFGASILGLGSDLTLEKSGDVFSREIPLPTTYRVGASYQAHEYVLAASDLVIADDDVHLHLGAESVIKEKFKLRAGYMFGYDSKNFTAGAAFIVRNITVDYAFVPFSNNLGTSHLFNLTFSL